MSTRRGWVIAGVAAAISAGPLGCFSIHDSRCVDEDGDGFGEGRGCAGPDCDDTDLHHHEGCAPACSTDPGAAGCPCEEDEGDAPLPCWTGQAGQPVTGGCQVGLRRCRDGSWTGCEGEVTPAAEACNGVDDDCDGTVDDGVLSACGDCDRSCRSLCVGIGCDDAFVPGNGAALAPDGALVAGSDESPRHLWVLDGDIATRVDVASREAIASFRVGPSGIGVWASAVALDSQGDALVSTGKPEGTGLVRFSWDDCVDANEDGRIDTSRSTVALDWGADECKTWDVDVEPCEPGQWEFCWPRGIALTEAGDRVWVSVWQSQTVVELDAHTGERTGRAVYVEGWPNALVADGSGSLWVGSSDDLVHRVRLDDLERVELLQVGGRTGVLDFDDEGRIFVGPRLLRFDPATGAVDATEVDVNSFAVDLDRAVWATSSELWRIDADSLQVRNHLRAGWGQVVVDLDGAPWTASDGSRIAVREADTGQELEAVDVGFCRQVERPEHCSLHIDGDPTGLRFRRAYGVGTQTRYVFEAGCSSPEWSSIDWSTRGKGKLDLSARIVPAGGEPGDLPWTAVVITSEPSGTVDLPELRAPDGSEGATRLEVRARLGGPALELELERIEVIFHCR